MRRSAFGPRRIARAALPALLALMAGGGCQGATDAPTTVTPPEVIVPSTPCATDLGTFGGLHWKARTDALSGPGPNAWHACQAWLDSAGMHLRLDKRNGVWTSAEVYTTETPGYGRFEFEITTRLDQLDPNVVLGLFTYPTGGLDGQHEIDIELARFGNAAAGAPNLNYVVYPATKLTTTQGRCALSWDVPSAPSVHRFFWSATEVAFQSFATNAVGTATAPYRAWRFVPTGAFTVSSGAWPLHLNLWLYGGRAPLNNSPVEVVIRRVTVSSSLPTTVAPSTTCR